MNTVIYRLSIHEYNHNKTIKHSLFLFSLTWYQDIRVESGLKFELPCNRDTNKCFSCLLLSPLNNLLLTLSCYRWTRSLVSVNSFGQSLQTKARIKIK